MISLEIALILIMMFGIPWYSSWVFRKVFRNEIKKIIETYLPKIPDEVEK